jgi:hypothetical protein
VHFAIVRLKEQGIYISINNEEVEEVMKNIILMSTT